MANVCYSTELRVPNYPVMLSNWRSTTVSLKTYPLLKCLGYTRLMTEPTSWFTSELLLLLFFGFHYVLYLLISQPFHYFLYLNLLLNPFHQLFLSIKKLIAYGKLKFLEIFLSKYEISFWFCLSGSSKFLNSKGLSYIVYFRIAKRKENMFLKSSKKKM